MTMTAEWQWYVAGLGTGLVAIALQLALPGWLACIATVALALTLALRAGRPKGEPTP